MRKIFSIVMPLIVSSFANAADQPFYIGTYTNKPPSEGIYSAVLDTKTGQIKDLKLAAKIDSPSYLALSKDGTRLYAATGDGSVAAFKRDSDGTLTPLNVQPTGGKGICHVSLDQSGKVVLAANYGGTAATLPIKEDGSLSEPAFFEEFTGSGPNTRRQEKAHPHSAFASPDNQFAYICDLGSDKIWSYKLDPRSGKLTAAEPAFSTAPAGGGPRHLVFHPSKEFVYANNELTNSVTVYSRNPETGELKEIQTASTLDPATSPEKVTNAAIRFHPSGKWLYVSNRSCDSVGVFSVAEDGKVTLIQEAPAGVKVPRDFAIDPSGEYLVVAGQNDDRVATQKIDPATGKITLTENVVTVGRPVNVLFVGK